MQDHTSYSIQLTMAKINVDEVYRKQHRQHLVDLIHCKHQFPSRTVNMPLVGYTAHGNTQNEHRKMRNYVQVYGHIC